MSFAVQPIACDKCETGIIEERLVKYIMSTGDRLIVVENVPAVVCVECGDIKFSPEVVANLHTTIWNERRPVRFLQTPVYDFAGQLS